MKFFKNAVYVLFSLSLLNLAGSFYMFKHIMNKESTVEVRIPIEKELRELPFHSRLRESQIIQAILMTHHQLGIHEPGSQPICPMCQDSEIKTITVENN